MIIEIIFSEGSPGKRKIADLEVWKGWFFVVATT